MSNRPIMIATLLGASIGVPYAVSRMSPSGESVKTSGVGSSSSWFGSSGSSARLNSLALPSLVGGANTNDNQATLEGAQYYRLDQVLRFDLTRDWVYSNWARKSTGLSDPQMFGIRVPLVTGTDMTDLAGSLTYYFNREGQVQHISFHGRTADTTKLVQFLIRTYKLAPVEAPAGEKWYQVKRGSLVLSQLRTWPESVLWSTSPHGSIVVELELERPGSSRSLVPITPRLDIPQVASTSVPTHPDEDADGGADGSGKDKPALVGDIRPATQAEQHQVLSKRWPN